MKKLAGSRVPVAVFDRHTYICDLINFEGPLLSLYRDERYDWLYLWCDSDGPNTDRWLVFIVDRQGLVSYLQKKVPLVSLIEDAPAIFALDRKAAREVGQGAPTLYRRAVRVTLDSTAEYLPDADSYFDETLTPDISVAREIAPANFEVPIKGRWFLPDIGKFSKGFTRLYAFLYCTQPRFVANLDEKLRRYMRSPWQGGYSRVNFFDAMHRQIPSVHDMRVAGYAYNSPGEITIEALDSVGNGVKDLVLTYIAKRDEIGRAERAIDNALGVARVKKQNLSRLSDSMLLIKQEHLVAIRENTSKIGVLLRMSDEFARLQSIAPNSVVFAKVILSLLRQISKVSEYQTSGMLDLERQE